MVEGGFGARDVLDRLLELATQEAMREPIANLVVAFGRQACIFPAWGVWVPVGRQSAAEGAVMESVEDPPRPLDDDEIKQRCVAACENFGEVHNFEVLQVRVASCSGPRWALQLSSVTCGLGKAGTALARGELWLGFECPGLSSDQLAARLDEFRRDLSGWMTLFRAFSALWKASKSAKLAALLAGSKFDFEASGQARARRASELLGKIQIWQPDSQTRRELAEEIGISNLQEAFAAPRLRYLEEEWEILESDFRQIGGSPAAMSATVVSVARCLKSALGDSGPPPALMYDPTISPDILALEVMASCTGLLTWVRRSEREGSFRVEVGYWQSLARATVTALSSLLCHWSVQSGVRERARHKGVRSLNRQWEQKFMSIGYIPPWLCLWFGQELLRQEIGGNGERAGRGGMSEPAIWRYRADLAYVVREAIRVFLYGRRPDYRFQPAALSKALGTLVEWHAVRVVGLPAQLDIRGLLEIIGKSQPFESEELTAGHLQHVFEVYITGHFLAKLRVKRGRRDAKHNLAGILAGSDGMAPGLRETDFFRAFSLAALFHNVGRLLFPRWSPEIRQLGKLERGLAVRLQGVADALSSTAAGLADHCKGELLAHGHLHVEEDKPILRWIEEGKAEGHVDSAVLGAWFTHCATHGLKGLTPEVARQAVRAVVLHHAVTQPIRPTSDPAAALLLVCDELFAWNPDPAGSALHGGRRSIPFLSSARPRRYRFELLELEGLWFRRERLRGVGSVLVGELRLAKDQPAAWSFPRFQIGLAEPENSSDATILAVWLGLAQSFQRIEPPVAVEAEGPYPGFLPTVTIRSRLPARLVERGLTFRGLLEEVACHAPLTVRPSLEEWLGHLEGALIQEGGSKHSVETIVIRPRGKALHSQDLRRYLEELERLADLVVLRRRAPSEMPRP